MRPESQKLSDQITVTLTETPKSVPILKLTSVLSESENEPTNDEKAKTE